MRQDFTNDFDFDLGVWIFVEKITFEQRVLEV